MPKRWAVLQVISVWFVALPPDSLCDVGNPHLPDFPLRGQPCAWRGTKACTALALPLALWPLDFGKKIRLHCFFGNSWTSAVHSNPTALLWDFVTPLEE